MLKEVSVGLLTRCTRLVLCPWTKKAGYATARALPVAMLGQLAMTGCQATYNAPDLGGLYNRPAQHHSPKRNPVIVIPGIMGSHLVVRASGRPVWGVFDGNYVDPTDSTDARLIALPLVEEPSFTTAPKDLEAEHVLERVRVDMFGLDVTLRAYMKILGVLGVGGYRDQTLGEAGSVDYSTDHYTCFQFPYDWRLDNAANARHLASFIDEKRNDVRQERRKRFGVANTTVHFDIVAHSMGGLVARYYLRYGAAALPDDGSPPDLTWAGAEHVDRLILVGTPSAGAIESFRVLLEGRSYPLWLPDYEPALVGTFPALYQLLPRSRHGMVVVDVDGEKAPVNLYDHAVWQKYGWGLADPDQEDALAVLMPSVSDGSQRADIVNAYLQACLQRARRFHQALDKPASPPPGTRLYLFAGDSEPTEARVLIDPKTGAIRSSTRMPGDGSVPRYSALMDERTGGDWQPRLRSPVAWHEVHMLFESHLDLTRSRVFADNVLFLLLEAPRLPPP